MSRFLLFGIMYGLSLGVWPAALADDAPESLIKNGELKDANGDGLPDGWYKLTQAEGKIQMLSEADVSFVRMGRGAQRDNCILQQFRPLPETQKLELSAKVRWTDIAKGDANWKVGAVALQFADPDGKRVGPFHNLKSMVYSSDGWKTIKETYSIPNGATQFRIQLAVFQVSRGELDIAWVQATGSGDPREAAAEPASDNPKSAPKPVPKLPLPPGGGPEYGGIKGVNLLGEDPYAALRPYRQIDDFDATRVPVQNQPFDEALRIHTRLMPTYSWDMQVRGTAAAPINEGDQLLLTMYVRGIEVDSEFAEATFRTTLELDAAPWTKTIDMTVREPVAREWLKIQKVFTANQTLPAKDLAFSMHFGFDKQTFEVGGLSLYNYGSSIDKAALPQTPRRMYEGFELDHPWRAEAAARIDQIRKADLAVSVVDSEGNAVPDAQVHVEMTRHGFNWGTAIYRWMITGDGPDNRMYKQKAAELFNMIATENAFKWPDWESGDKSQDAARQLVEWAEANDMKVRGHTVVWPSFKRSPKRLEALKHDPEALRAEINAHIQEMVSQYVGRIYEWDVMNEPNTNHDFMDLMGIEEAARWYAQVHEIDPEARLFINENSILNGVKLGSYEYWIGKLVEYGAPLGGIGIQGHLGFGTASPQRMWATYDRLAKFGVPLAITELDILTDDPEMQAHYLRDVMIAAFSHPAIESFVFWGFWDGRHWKENSPLYAKDWTPKPGLDVYKQLVFHDWWTDEQLITNAQGQVSTRGFLGDYRVTVTHSDQAEVYSGTLERGGAQWTIQLKPVTQVSADDVIEVDPKDTYSQEFTVEFASAADAQQAELAVAPLLNDKQWAFSARWDDNHQNNFPVHDLMAKHGIKGTFYLNGTGSDYAQQATAKLTTDGCSIGAHTRTHSLLTALAPNPMLYETLGNRIEWEALSDRPINSFAFPFGRYRTWGYDQSYQDVTEALRRAGFHHTTYLTFNQDNPYLSGKAIVGSHEVVPGDRKVDAGKFDQQMAKLLANRDSAAAQSRGIHMGVHARQTGQALNDLGKVFAKYAHNPDWWYCSLSDFAGYTHQANHSSVERLAVDGATARYRLARPSAGASGTAVPLTLSVQAGAVKAVKAEGFAVEQIDRDGTALLNVSHSASAGLPTRIDAINNPNNDPVGLSAAVSADFPGLSAWLWHESETGVLRLRLQNTSEEPLRDLAATLRLPLSYAKGVRRFTLPDVPAGQTYVMRFDLGQPELGPQFEVGQDYYVAELNFHDGKGLGRLYTTTRSTPRPGEAVVLRDAVRMMGPWALTPDMSQFESVSQPGTQWTDLGSTPDRQWFTCSQKDRDRLDPNRASLYRYDDGWKDVAGKLDYKQQTYIIAVDFTLSQVTDLLLDHEGKLVGAMLNGTSVNPSETIGGTAAGDNRLVLAITVKDNRSKWSAFPLYLKILPASGERIYSKAPAQP